MYPIAYAVAEAENYATWTWFLEFLAVDLSIENSNGYVFITDRQNGLIDAVGDMFPNFEHRHCLKHLHANFILAGHGGLVLKQHMEATARSTTIPWFQAEMKKLKDLSGPAFDWLSRLDPMQWCRSHFRTHSKCDILLNNMCEAFNKSILDARDKPIITLLERIRVFATIEKLKKQLAWCIPRLAGESKYEVKCFGGTQAFIKAYTPMVHPMASQDLWAKTNLPPLLPPKFHKQPRRPKKTRKASAGEPSPSSNPKAKHLPRYNLEIKCSICKQLGHNKRKCPRVNEVGSSSQVPSQRQKKTAHQANTSTQRITRQSRQKQLITSKAKKRGNRHQASSQSGQAPQSSHQAAQPSQPSH
ncbi:unnamed protein product [Prunus armeniaca]